MSRDESTLSDPAAALAARLRQARGAASLSQEETAAKLGCSVRSLQDYEAGKAFPRAKLRRRVLAFIAEQEEEIAA